MPELMSAVVSTTASGLLPGALEMMVVTIVFPASVIVPVIVIQLSRNGLVETPGNTVRVAVRCIPFSAAVIVKVVAEVTTAVVIVKVADVCPAATRIATGA
jgi:hypothetical protein